MKKQQQQKIVYQSYPLRYVNSDLITLKNNVKSGDVDVDDVITQFFNYVNNPLGKMRIRLVANVFVKMFYVIVNVIAFTATDVLINGQFRTYGRHWLQWARHDNAGSFYNEYYPFSEKYGTSTASSR